MIKTIECVVCGATAEVEHNRGRAPVACSPECNRERERTRKLAWAKTPKGRKAQARERANGGQARVAKWQKDNREQHRSHMAKAKAKRRDAAVRESDPKFVKHNFCQVCGSTHNLEVEHLTPLAAGGTHYIENLTTMCADCNRGQGGKHVLGPHVWSEFVRWFLDRRDNPHEKVQKIVTL